MGLQDGHQFNVGCAESGEWGQGRMSQDLELSLELPGALGEDGARVSGLEGIGCNPVTVYALQVLYRHFKGKQTHLLVPID